MWGEGGRVSSPAVSTVSFCVVYFDGGFYSLADIKTKVGYALAKAAVSPSPTLQTSTYFDGKSVKVGDETFLGARGRGKE